MVDGLLCIGLLRTEPSPDISDLIEGVLGWKYPPPFGVLTIDDAVCTVCGEPGLGISLNEKSERRSTIGVVYGRPVCEESWEETVGARLRVSESEDAARASSIIAGSSSTIPLRISANTAMMSLNSVSVRHLVEKRAYS
jgi:hypothetical protein